MATPAIEHRRVEAALRFLTRLGAAMLESGFATEAMELMVLPCAAALGLEDARVVGIGRVVIVECADGTGRTTSRLGEAASLDSFDCDRMRRLKDVAREVVTRRLDPESACARLDSADAGPAPFPWWSVQAGGMLLAFCICVQIGGTPLAGVLAALSQLVVNLSARGFGAVSEPLRLPMSALALVGITGALLPGLIVCQGLILSVYEVAGVSYFVQAGAVCVGLGVGASLGVYLWSLVARFVSVPLPK
ncbi:threonine/serine exporter family protein [Nocardia sp. NPDC050717]|uniref:threonine/serine exporter family protein n=1 Tax=Nocardia sp. NPDC050717 TaxID=3157221 RepID=UPI0033C2F86E